MNRTLARRRLAAAVSAFFLLASLGAAAQPAAQPAAGYDAGPDRTDAAARPAVAPEAGPPVLSLSLREAVLSALENNPSVAARRLAARGVETGQRLERGAFDPQLSAGIRGSRDSGGGAAGSGEAGVSLNLPTGTLVSAGASAARTPGAAADSSVGLDVTVTQSLLRGGPVQGAGLVGIRMARLDAFSSRHEFRGFAESLVFSVESAYWARYLAERQLEIYRESLRLALQHLDNTRRRIQVGVLPELDLAAAEVEAALRREALIGAEGRAETARLQLLQLASPRTGDFWDAPVELTDRPAEPEPRLDEVKAHVELGLRSRADLAQARLAREKGELEVVRTRNGLLPRLDFFIALGAAAYDQDFGSAAEKVFNRGPRLSGGLTFSFPLGNNAAAARAEKAAASRAQADEALRNLERLAELEIRTAYVAVERSRSQIAAVAETSRLQEEKLKAETEKYSVGRSTSYAVSLAGRDLLEARLGEAQAVVGYLTALLALYRAEGTLLQRRGIEPVI